MIKNICLLMLTACSLLLTACGRESEKALKARAHELCRYIPAHGLVEGSERFLTSDFYALLDSMFTEQPDDGSVVPEWVFYFVTSDGGTISDYEVKEVTLSDDTHAIATILARQQWEDGSFDEDTDIEEHLLYMEKQDGAWLMSDFDDHKKDCIRRLHICRQK